MSLFLQLIKHLLRRLSVTEPSGDRPSDVCEGASYATVWRERGGAPAVAELVGICWQQEPGARPTFAEVVAKLDAVVATLST